MLLYLDFLWSHDTGDGACFVGNKGSAEYAHGHLAIHLLLAIYAQFLYEFLLCVADEREREVVLLDEFLVALGILCAHADNYISQREETLIVVTQIASLIGASWCGVARINIKYYLLATEFGKSPFFSVLVKAKNLCNFCPISIVIIFYGLINYLLMKWG